MKRRIFTVIIKSPDDTQLTKADLRKYISDAIKNWSGQCDPDVDPLWIEIYEHKNRVVVTNGS